LKEHAHPIRPVGHGSRKTQKNQHGKRNQGTTAGEGVDKSGEKSGSYGGGDEIPLHVGDTIAQNA
jgi:hypothetical protein